MCRCISIGARLAARPLAAIDACEFSALADAMQSRDHGRDVVESRQAPKTGTELALRAVGAVDPDRRSAVILLGQQRAPPGSTTRRTPPALNADEIRRRLDRDALRVRSARHGP